MKYGANHSREMRMERVYLHAIQRLCETLASDLYIVADTKRILSTRGQTFRRLERLNEYINVRRERADAERLRQLRERYGQWGGQR